MSKITPEIGDIWIDEFKHRLYVSYSDKVTTCVNVYYKTAPYIGLDKYDVDTKEFIKEFTYLGKSKINIDNIFEVENE